MLAEQEEAARADGEPEDAPTTPLVELDEEQLGSIAESIADQAAAYFAGQVQPRKRRKKRRRLWPLSWRSQRLSRNRS